MAVVRPLVNTFPIVQGFLPNKNPPHLGIDIAAPLGTPIFAPVDAIVVQGLDRPAGSVEGFGNWVWLDAQAGSGVDLIFGHMRHEDILVRHGDQVLAGQQIASVGAEGQATGPHLHFEVWGPPGRVGGATSDPEVFLAAAVDLVMVRQPDATTLFGVDISNNQGGNFDIEAVKREGFTFMTAKVTGGDGFKDPFWPHYRDLMRKNFPGLFGGYHFVNPASGESGSPADQADNLASHIGDLSIPIQLDYENEHGSIAEVRALVEEITKRGMRVFALYLPHFIWNDIGSPDLDGLPPLWNADFPSSEPGFAFNLFPGKDYKGFKSFNGHPVKILQFSEHGQVAGHLVDVDAFVGTVDELRELFGAPIVPEPAVLDLWAQLLGKDGTGWHQLGDRTFVDGLATVGQKLGIAGFAPPAGATNVKLPADAVRQVHDMWIQLMGDNGLGWPQLGGRTFVDGLATVGQKLGIAGFAPPAGAPNVQLPPDVDGMVLDMWIQFMGDNGLGWPQLGGRTFVDGLATVGQKLGIAGFAPPPGPTNVPLRPDTGGRVRDMVIQFLGISGTGWPQLGRHTFVDGLATIGHSLGIASFNPPE